ncbi:hypothetical protein ACLK19_21530 [Escherichia coli]
MGGFEHFQQGSANLLERAWLARKPISARAARQIRPRRRIPRSTTRTWCARCNRRYKAASTATIRNTRSWLMSVEMMLRHSLVITPGENASHLLR